MERIYRWPYLLGLFLLAYMPFHVFLSQWLSTYSGQLDTWKVWKDVLLFAGILLVTALVYIRRSFKDRYFWIFFAISALYFALHLLVWKYTDVPDKTALLATAYNCRLLGYAIVGWGAGIVSSKYLTAKKIFTIAIIISTVICILGIVQSSLPKDILTHFGYSLDRGARPAFFIDNKPDLPRIMSTLRDPNSFGAYLILPIVVLVGGWLRKPKMRMMFTGLLTLHVLALLLTFSRSALAGAIIGSAMIFIWNYKEKSKIIIKKYWPMLAAGVVILLALGFAMRNQYFVQNVIFHSDENTKMTDSNNLHFQFAEKGIRGIADKPLGHGPGTAGLVSIHTKNVVLTENYFIQIGYEVGILGLAMLIGMMAFICRLLYKVNDFYSWTLLSAFAGITLCSLLLLTWSNEAVACQWWLLAGLIVGLRQKPVKAGE
jgi:hypothetical protein